MALKDKEYPDEKYGSDRLSDVESSRADHAIHPTHDDDGNLWIYPTEDEISGAQPLRRVVDKM